MSTTHTTSGVTVTEYEESDTLDLTLEAPDPQAEAWERLADTYAANELCPGCFWHESGVNTYNGARYRECSAFSPDACPGVNPKAIANALRRQAS